MTEQDFINEVIMPEAERQGVKLRAELHKERDGRRDFALLFEVSGERHTHIMGIDPESFEDVSRGVEPVRNHLIGIKQLITSNGSAIPEGWTVFPKLNVRAA